MKKAMWLAGVILALGLGFLGGKKLYQAPPGVDSAAAPAAGAGPVGNDAAAAALRSQGATGKTFTVSPGQSIQAAVQQAAPGDVVQVMPGEYHETVFIDKDGITLFGVIQDGRWPTLIGDHKLNDAILFSGSGVRVENMKVSQFKGNAIMSQAGNNFAIRHNWIVDSGVYGIFPEFARNGLIEGNVISGAEDAAIYVGMSDNIHVADNEVHGSVAGLEFENSRHAVAENNLLIDNAGGILAFITPGLPIKTAEDLVIRHNFVAANNHANFAAPGSIVSGLPSGTGIVVMAAKRVTIEDNVIRDNKNTGIVIVDHKSFANVTVDADSDQAPGDIRILDNLMTGNGTEPVAEIKALMLATLQKEPPEIVSAGENHGSCILHKSRYRTVGLNAYTACQGGGTADLVSYLLPEPAPKRDIDLHERGKLAYYSVCAGCHGFNSRLVGPPVQVIQALYADNAQGIVDYITHPVKKREDFPAMPPQDYLSPELRRAAAEYMLSLKQ